MLTCLNINQLIKLKSAMLIDMSDNHIATSNNKLNQLRAAVLGANDGIVSTAGLVLGVAGASSSSQAILTAGVAGLVAGAISMAAGEYVSVSSQRDSEKAFLIKNRQHIKDSHDDSAKTELIEIYETKGISKVTATQVANELETKGNLWIELQKEQGVDPDDMANPWTAAIASALSFIAGAIIPLAAMTFSPDNLRIEFTAGAVLISLVLAGVLSARAGEANKGKAALRVVSWGVGAMAITYGVGYLLGVGTV